MSITGVLVSGVDDDFPRPEEAPVLLVLATAPAMIGLAYWLGAP